MIGSYQYFLTAKQTNVTFSKENMTLKAKPERKFNKRNTNFFFPNETKILLIVIKESQLFETIRAH